MAFHDLPRWRQLESTETFEAFSWPNADDTKGYAVSTWVLLFDHETCGCLRSQVPEHITWFLPHSDEHHGRYPMHPEILGKMWHYQLCNDLPTLRPGNILQMEGMRRGVLRSPIGKVLENEVRHPFDQDGSSEH